MSAYRSDNLGKLLEGKTDLDGVPIIRSPEVQDKISAGRYLMVYPNGNVMLWEIDRGTYAEQWNPDRPIGDQ